MKDAERLYSNRSKEMKASEIREMLKIIQDPEIISFAGGMPSPDSFPYEEIERVAKNILREHGKVALQYGSTEGVIPFRKVIAKMAIKDGINIDHDNILITNGSQQALDMIGKIFLNHGDLAFVGLPTYLAAINAFKPYSKNLVGIPLDEEGMQVDLLEEKIRELAKKGITPKFVYVLPTYHNPAGTLMLEKRRKKIIDLACEYDLLVIEDDPYGKLRYEGDKVKPIKAFDDEEHVLYLGTSSKILCPGFRLGWSIGPKEIIRKMVIAKQSMDLCTNVFSQWIACEIFAKEDLLDHHIEEIIKLYRPRRDAMIKTMKECFPDGYKCTKPQGGLFMWVILPEGIDTKEMLPEAIKEKVAYISGKAFNVDGSGANTMRLNFSYSPEDTIEEGIKRLGRVIEKRI